MSLQLDNGERSLMWHFAMCMLHCNALCALVSTPNRQLINFFSPVEIKLLIHSHQPFVSSCAKDDEFKTPFQLTSPRRCDFVNAVNVYKATTTPVVTVVYACSPRCRLIETPILCSPNAVCMQSLNSHVRNRDRF